MDHRVWINQTVDNLDKINNLSLADSQLSVLDTTAFSYVDPVTSVSHGFLHVPSDGEYSIEVSGKSVRVRVYFTETGSNEAEKVSLNS